VYLNIMALIVLGSGEKRLYIGSLERQPFKYLSDGKSKSLV
jgi:hypothetical protein